MSITETLPNFKPLDSSDLDDAYLATCHPNVEPSKVDYSAPAFLEKGAAHMRNRAEQRDAPNGERSMAKTVAAFNAIYDTNLSEEQGWFFMVLLKQVRAAHGIFVADDYEDAAAYCGLAGEAAAQQRAA